MSQLLSAGQHILCLMPTLKECADFNSKMLSLEEEDIIELQAKDKLEHQGLTIGVSKSLQAKLDSLDQSASHTAGFEKTLQICKNCQVILRRNLNVDEGLVNGAMGKVVGVKNYPNKNEVEYIEVQFDHIHQVKKIGRCVARFLLVKDLYVRREQFPLSLAYAVTIHKSQGLSVDYALISIGNSVFKEGMSYVALSRVRSLNGLYLMDFDATKLTADSSCVKEYNRLRSIYTPELELFPIYEKRAFERKRKIPQKPSLDTKKHDEKSDAKKKKITYNLDENTVGYQFENYSGVNCYNNVVLNVLFTISEITENILLNANQALCGTLHELLHRIRGDRTAIHSVAAVRDIVDVCAGIVQFTRNIQQDAQEFLMYIFNILDNEGIPINHFFGIDYSWINECVNCQHRTQTNFNSERFIYLIIPDTKVVSFDQLIRKACQNNVCNLCQSDVVSTLDVRNSGKYLVLMFQRCRADGTKINTVITDFKASQISLSGKTYTTKAIIFHAGNTISSGHYTVYLRHENGWCECNDQCITFKLRLPYKLPNSYLIFMERKV